ncbi:MAG: hydratase [Actinomycetia bacterium]|nr:hydratase [Actinomycetes bacterium]
MDRAAVSQAASTLHRARAQGLLLDDLGPNGPVTLAEAYEVQDELAELTADTIAGWKIGCTGAAAQELLGVPHPFGGRVFTGHLLESGAAVAASALQHPAVEGEIVFELASELPARSEPYTPTDVAAATRGIRPAIELVDTRFADLTTAGAVNLIADVGANGGLVVGDLLSNWTDLDLAALEVTMAVGDEMVGQGTGADVLGHPLEALAWLANDLSSRGQGLAAGALVSTGTCTQVAPLRPGATAVTDHGPLGSVEVTWLA